VGNGAKERPALINGSKERLAFQIAEDERKERVECRASVDLSKHEGMYRKDLEVGWDLHGRPHDICGIKAGLYLCLAAVREGVNGGRAEQNAASSSRSAFRTLDVAAIGQRYNPADEGILLEMSQGKGVGGVDWGVYAPGRSSFPCLDLACLRPGS